MKAKQLIQGVKQPEVVCVCTYDTSAIYVNGKLAMADATRGHYDLVEVLGHKITDMVPDYDVYKRYGKWPENLAELEDLRQV